MIALVVVASVPVTPVVVTMTFWVSMTLPLLMLMAEVSSIRGVFAEYSCSCWSVLSPMLSSPVGSDMTAVWFSSPGSIAVCHVLYLLLCASAAQETVQVISPEFTSCCSFAVLHTFKIKGNPNYISISYSIIKLYQHISHTDIVYITFYSLLIFILTPKLSCYYIS